MSVEMTPCHLNHLISSTPVLGMDDGRRRAPPAAWEWTGAVATFMILTAWAHRPKSPHPVATPRQVLRAESGEPFTRLGRAANNF